ncbi:hypothetical protein BGZ79_003144, partial [Entomortierella chlamydospora]
MKKTSIDNQNSIVSQLKAGYSVKDVARRLSLSVVPVLRIRTKCLPTLERQAAGRPRILSARTKNDLTRKLLSGQLKTGVQTLTSLRDGGTEISYRSVVRNLREM